MGSSGVIPFFWEGVYCVRLPFSQVGGATVPRVPIGGIYNAVLICRSFFTPSLTVHAILHRSYIALAPARARQSVASLDIAITICLYICYPNVINIMQ